MNESSSHHRHKSRKVVYDLYCLSNKTSLGTFHTGLSVSRRRFFLNPQLCSVFWPLALPKQKYWVISLPHKLHQNPPVRQRKQFHSRENIPLGKYTPLDTLCDSRNKAEKGDLAWHSRIRLKKLDGHNIKTISFLICFILFQRICFPHTRIPLFLQISARQISE